MSRLDGRRILITRAQEDARDWSERIERWGAEPRVLPCIACRIRDDESTRRALLEALDGADWLALTSRRGVDAVTSLAAAEVLAARPVAAVGDGTARACGEAIGRVDLVAPDGTGRSLGHALAGAVSGLLAAGRAPVIAVAAADRAPAELESILEPLGVTVRRIVVYETQPAPEKEPRVDLEADGIEVVLLASPSAVEGLAAQAKVAPSVQLISIGPATSRAIRAAGWTVAGEAKSRDLEGLLEAIP